MGLRTLKDYPDIPKDKHYFPNETDFCAQLFIYLSMADKTGDLAALTNHVTYMILSRSSPPSKHYGPQLHKGNEYNASETQIHVC